MDVRNVFYGSIVLILATSTILASPVLPVFDLDVMPTDIACLYICNICYDGLDKDMDKCVNEICAKSGGTIVDHMKIGRECVHYKTIFEYSTGAFKKH